MPNSFPCQPSEHEGQAQAQEQASLRAQLQSAQEKLHTSQDALKKLQQLLVANEIRFRDIVENSLDAVYRRDLIDDIYDYMSPVIESILGFSPQEMHTMPTSAVLERIHPEDRAGVEAEIAHAEKTGRGKFEYRFLAKDGAYRWLDDRVIVVMDADGRPLYRGGVVRDITEQKRVEKTLRLRNDRLLLLSQAAGQILGAASHSDTMVRDLFAQVCRHLEVQVYFNYMLNDNQDGLRLDSYAGIPEEAARGIRCLDLGAAVCGLAAQVREPILVGEIQGSDDPRVQLVKHYGIRAYYCNPLMDGERLLGTLSFGSRTKDHFDEDELEFMRTISHYVAMAKMRTHLNRDLKRQNQQLAEADRRKDEFLAMLAHELRNPLWPIQTSAELIQRHLGEAHPRARQWTLTIQRQLAHLTRLVDELLDSSRISRGLITLHPEPVALGQIIAQAVDTMQSAAHAKQQDLQAEAWKGSPLVSEADPVRLTQILSNLIDNAVKFTPANGRIRIRCRQESRQAVVEVEDDGPGIAEDILPHIFDLFYQADKSLARTQGGLGLGLTLSRQLALLHGGALEARSRHPEPGTCFRLRLPLKPELPPQPTPAGPPSAAAAQGLKILLVEDNQDAAETLAEVLQLWGHVVSLAFDGLQALALARSFQPDVLLLDIGLPGMDGYEVARKLRLDPVFKNLRLVALTGYQTDSDRMAGSGFAHAFTKPVALEALEGYLKGTGER